MQCLSVPRNHYLNAPAVASATVMRPHISHRRKERKEPLHQYAAAFVSSELPARATLPICCCFHRARSCADAVRKHMNPPANAADTPAVRTRESLRVASSTLAATARFASALACTSRFVVGVGTWPRRLPAAHKLQHVAAILCSARHYFRRMSK